MGAAALRGGVTFERTYQLILRGHDSFVALRIAALEARGIPVCDSPDHNDGCTNPRCPVWGNKPR